MSEDIEVESERAERERKISQMLGLEHGVLNCVLKFKLIYEAFLMMVSTLLLLILIPDMNILRDLHTKLYCYILGSYLITLID